MKFKGLLLLLPLVRGLAMSGSAANRQPQQSPAGSPLGFAKSSYETLPLAPIGSASPYDEQVGVTFTQDFSVLAFNVTAVQFTDSSGVGPGYLVNGLTNLGYWYQVGLSYNWPLISGGINIGFQNELRGLRPLRQFYRPYKRRRSAGLQWTSKRR